MSVSRTYFRYSRTVKWITGSCLALIASLSLLGVFQFEDIYESYRNSIFHTIALIVPLLGLFGVFLYFAIRAPRYYVLHPDGIYIKFLWGGVFYHSDRYDIIQGVPYSEIKDSVRVFGSGGYFGYIGLFKITRSNRICRFYLTNKDGKLIKLIDKTGKRDIYISG